MEGGRKDAEQWPPHYSRRHIWPCPPRGHQTHPVFYGQKTFHFFPYLYMLREKIPLLRSESGNQFSPDPPCGSQGLNSGHPAWWLRHLAFPQVTFCGLSSFAREHCITSPLALTGKWKLRSGGGITCRPQLSRLYWLSADLGLVLLPGSYCIIQTQLLAGGLPGETGPPSCLHPCLSQPSASSQTPGYQRVKLAHPLPELQE